MKAVLSHIKHCLRRLWSQSVSVLPQMTPSQAKRCLDYGSSPQLRLQAAALSQKQMSTQAHRPSLRGRKDGHKLSLMQCEDSAPACENTVLEMCEYS